MKRFFYPLFVIFGLVFYQHGQAQVSVQVNIGSQPLWGPVGYDYARYYYLPELDVYYNVNNRKYTYWNGHKWTSKSKLPRQYNNFNIYRTYKVVINDPNPWMRHPQYRNKYSRYAHNHGQVIIRDQPRGPHAPHRDRHGKPSKHEREQYRKQRPGSRR